MGSNHKLLILAEVCKQRLLELRPENAQTELQKTYGIARIDKDPLEEKLEPMYVPTEDIKIINTGSLLEPTADNCNHSDRKYLSPIEVITIRDKDENTKKFIEFMLQYHKLDIVHNTSNLLRFSYFPQFIHQ